VKPAASICVLIMVATVLFSSSSVSVSLKPSHELQPIYGETKKKNQNELLQLASPSNRTGGDEACANVASKHTTSASKQQRAVTAAERAMSPRRRSVPPLALVQRKGCQRRRQVQTRLLCSSKLCDASSGCPVPLIEVEKLAAAARQ
jgi:hypothetical protein